MFKIIKTSTYNKMVKIIEKQRDLLINAHIQSIKQVRDNIELQKQIHNLTAKKLPIKKSKNK